MLANRIKDLLPQLISQEQSAFLPQRRVTDNIILAQELMQFVLKSKTKKKQPFIMKIDMEKVFDSLEWSFIRTVLFFFNFPSYFITLIMECISSTFVSVLINGQPTNFFYPSRGIKQGDPPSPYIFILCMDYLSYLIKYAVN